MNDKILEIKNIQKIINKKLILKNINLSITRNKIHGFIGPNGAGKSTTLMLILKIMKIDKGSIIFNGKDIYKSVFSNHYITYVMSEPNFPDDTIVLDFLIDLAILKNIPKEKILLKLKNSVLNQFANTYCNKLSTGWKKILQIFSSTITVPELLLLDEPFNGLDPIFREELSKLIIKLNKEHGISILFSSHILHDIEFLAQEMTIIKEGTTIYEGNIPKNLESFFYDILKIKPMNIF